LLTGRLPFEAASEYEIASAHLKSSPVDPTAINPNIPVRLSKIVLKSLSKSPGDRFQTAKEFLNSLSLVQTGETTTLATSTLPRHAEGSLTSDWPMKQAIDTNVLDSVSRDLAYHVGPIAKVIVSRAAKRAISLDELFKLLATEISSEKSRQDFLATRIKYSTLR
jgi:eukaryotic-like serine/threonine-protein kinase